MPKVETIQRSLYEQVNVYKELFTPSASQISEDINEESNLIIPDAVISDLRDEISNKVALAILEFASKMKQNYTDNDTSFYWEDEEVIDPDVDTDE